MNVCSQYFLAFILTAVVTISAGSTICTKSEEPCLQDDDCCGGYCVNNKCFGDEELEPKLGTTDVCDSCPLGQKCVMMTSCSCSNDCTLKAVCVTPLTPEEDDPCLKCASGYKCQYVSGSSKPQCIPEST